MNVNSYFLVAFTFHVMNVSASMDDIWKKQYLRSLKFFSDLI